MAIEEEDDGGGIPEWVVTFGDMMSLLLTFFIMLVSLSEIKEEDRYQAMVESMTRRFGYDSSMASFAPGPSQPRSAKIEKVAAEGRARRMNAMQGGDKVQAPVGDYPRVRIVRPGEKASIGTVVFFPEGSVELTDEAKQALQEAVKTIGGHPQKIEIRGHTSNRPIPSDSPFHNHWEMAYLRTHNTFEYLVNELGIDSRRIRTSQAGPNEPLHILSDPNRQKQNPRVEVFMLDEVTTDLMGTEKERNQRFTDGVIPGSPADEPKPVPADQ
jgi:chemotaxis protein MotB